MSWMVKKLNRFVQYANNLFIVVLQRMLYK